MKKVFAALASCAVAVSMFAFAGCGDKTNTGNGEIPGDYTEKTPEQMEDIVKDLDFDKIFSEDITGMGLKVNLSGSFAMGEMMSGNGSVAVDYKLLADENGMAGVGSATVNGVYKNNMASTPQELAVDASASVYNDSQYVYAATQGTAMDKDLNDMKVKLNMQELAGAFGGLDGIGGLFGYSTFAAEDSEGGLDVAALLAMATEYGVKVTVDNKDGIKFKLSASEETVWKLVRMYINEDVTDEEFAEVKEAVTFNKFQLDVYFALDANGVFSKASMVVDGDVKVAGSFLFGDMMDADDEGVEIPDLTITLKGSVEIYAHNDAVTLPEGLATDETYIDVTETIIEMFGD